MTWTHQIVTRLIDHSINFFARFLFAFCSLFVRFLFVRFLTSSASFPYKFSATADCAL